MERPEDLRIAFFADAFHHRNGVGAYYCDLIAYLASRVAEAELVCPGKNEAGREQGLSLPLPGDRSQKLCLPSIPKAWRLVKRMRPHVIVAASPGPYGILAAVLAWHCKVRFCFGYHTQYGALASLYWNRVFGPLAQLYLAWLDRRFFRRSDAVFTNGTHMARTAEELGARRVKLIGTPIDPLLLKPPVPLAETSFGPVLFVGRLAPEKNITKIIEAARALPDVSFIIAGDGPLARQVQEVANERPNVEYLGWVDREALLKLLDERCEVLVLPSQVEAFGTVAGEAMARERLALVSNRCGIVDWPELAEGLEVFDADASLVPKLRELAALPHQARDAKRIRARQQCDAFVKKTVRDWKETLFDVASK